MGETRTNPVDGRTVFVAPERRDRPHDIALPRVERSHGDPARCPFCPHSDSLHPVVLDEYPAPQGGWRTRVVPNRFPLLLADPAPPAAAPPPYVAATSGGWHEVIVESPLHHPDLPDLDPQALAAAIETYRRRHRALAAIAGVASILLFRNRGPAAGASLAHPHAQIAALPYLPEAVKRRRDLAADHYARHGRVLLEDVAAAEIADGRRLLHRDGTFVAFVPFAAETPGEIWILPAAPQPSFSQIDDRDTQRLGEVLRACLAGLRLAFDDPDYNLVICDPPTADAMERSQCWHLRIHPRTSRYGGYEIGWGDRINPSLPERDAALLRSAMGGGKAVLETQ